MRTRVFIGLCLPGMLLLSACTRQAEVVSAEPQATPFQLTASIQDIMHGIVDPAADLLWESVGTEVTQAGETRQQPHTDAEWNQVRNSAISLVEATNLLMMQGRRVVNDGKEVEDAHITGIRTAAEIQQAIDSDRATWIGFAQALHAAGEQTLKAVDAKDATALLRAGEALDEVCEACHIKYWYPGQVIPQWKAPKNN